SDRRRSIATSVCGRCTSRARTTASRSSRCAVERTWCSYSTPMPAPTAGSRRSTSWPTTSTRCTTRSRRAAPKSRRSSAAATPASPFAILDLVLLRTDRELAVPVSVTPLGMRIAEPAHAERDQRLELDVLLGVIVADQSQCRTLRPAQSRRPTHLVRRARKMTDALVGVPRGITIADDVEDGLASDPTITVGAFETQEVRAA